MSPVYAWIDSWQQQCCGTDFAVGSAVRWRVNHQPGGDPWVETMLGDTWAGRITYREDHHIGPTNGELTGTVTRIRVLMCERLPEAGHDRAGWVPRPGGGRLRDVDVADRWEPEPADPASPWSFTGWIVELYDATFTSDPPPRP